MSRTSFIIDDINMWRNLPVEFEIADTPIVDSWTPSPKAPSSRPFFVHEVVEVPSPSSPSSSPPSSPMVDLKYDASAVEPLRLEGVQLSMPRLDLAELEREMMYDRATD